MAKISERAAVTAPRTLDQVEDDLAKLHPLVREAMANHPKGKPLNELGQLVPDPTPMAPPIGYVKQPSMVDIIREQIRLAGLEAANRGFESFEEGDDFEVGEDYEPQSAYELDEEQYQAAPPAVLKAREAAKTNPPNPPPSPSLPSSPNSKAGGGGGGGEDGGVTQSAPPPGPSPSPGK